MAFFAIEIAAQKAWPSLASAPSQPLPTRQEVGSRPSKLQGVFSGQRTAKKDFDHGATLNFIRENYSNVGKTNGNTAIDDG